MQAALGPRQPLPTATATTTTTAAQRLSQSPIIEEEADPQRRSSTTAAADETEITIARRVQHALHNKVRIIESRFGRKKVILQRISTIDFLFPVFTTGSLKSLVRRKN